MTSDLHHLAAVYALDALADEERRDFEAHYPNCDICRAETRDFRSTATILGIAASEDASIDLRDSVMAEIAVTRQVSPLLPNQVVDLSERRRRQAPRPRMLAALAAALVVLAGVFGAIRIGSQTNEIDQLIAAPDSIVTDLEGEDGSLRVVWSRESNRAAILGSELPPPGVGRTYQLWFLLDDGVAPAATFKLDGAGSVREIQTLAAFERTTGWGVTIEPAGGSQQPTSDVVYEGSI